MSAYANDPRVRHVDYQEFGSKYFVQAGIGPNDDRPAVVEVSPGGTVRAYWRYEPYPPKAWLAETAMSADEAIRSLIGDPR